MAHRHPRGTLPPGDLQVMVGQEDEDGRKDRDVSRGPSQEDDPGEDQPEPQPIPQILSMCLLGLRPKKRTKTRIQPKGPGRSYENHYCD